VWAAKPIGGGDPERIDKFSGKRDQDMDEILRKDLRETVWTGGAAYVRNLAAAEAAILRGQFNLAKVLRAAGHSQRVLAMNAARLLVDEWELYHRACAIIAA
jgi:hypothetical protein